MGKNYYEILGITQSATQEEIRKAYLNKMKENHPDYHQDSKESTEKAKLINEAYETLKNPEKRKQYDSTIRFTRPTGTTRTNGYNQTYTYTSSYKPNNDKNNSSYTVNTDGTTGEPKKSKNSKNENQTDTIYDLLKADYFAKTKDYIKSLNATTLNENIINLNKKYSYYVESKQAFEAYIINNLDTEKGLKKIIEFLYSIWESFGDINKIFIKNDLVSILRKILQKTTIKDLPKLSEIYDLLKRNIVSLTKVDSLEYTIKTLLETDSILKYKNQSDQSKNNSSQTDEDIYEELKEDYFRKAKEFTKSIINFYGRKEINFDNGEYLSYITSKEKFESFLCNKLEIKEAINKILSILRQNWNRFNNDENKLIIMKDLLDILKKIFKKTTTKDFEMLYAIYLKVDNIIAETQPNSYDATIKKLLETDSILKDILNKNCYNNDNIFREQSKK